MASANSLAEKELQARDLERELLVRDFVIFPSRDQSIVVVKKERVRSFSAFFSYLLNCILSYIVLG